MFDRKLDIERIKRLAIEKAKQYCNEKWKFYKCKKFEVINQIVLDKFVMCKVQFKRNTQTMTLNIKVEI